MNILKLQLFLLSSLTLSLYSMNTDEESKQDFEISRPSVEPEEPKSRGLKKIVNFKRRQNPHRFGTYRIYRRRNESGWMQ